jgi:hypothetical protein
MIQRSSHFRFRLIALAAALNHETRSSDIAYFPGIPGIYRWILPWWLPRSNWNQGFTCIDM